MTALDILRARGIVFPEGSSASFIPTTNELVVRNTPENLHKLEDFLESIRDQVPVTIAFTFNIVQGEAAAMRQIEANTAAIANHTEVWRKIEAEAAQGRIKILRTTWIEGKSGQRVKAQSGDEHIFFTEMKISSLCAAEKPKNTSSDGKAATPPNATTSAGMPTYAPSFDMALVGTQIEVDPVIGPDGKTVDVNFSIEHDTAPPTLHQEPIPAAGDVMRVDAPGTDFHKSRLTSAVTLTGGMTRLLGIWKPETLPEGEKNTDVLQAGFMKVDIIKVEKEEKGKE
jgi:hypothetical protein